MVMPHNGTDKFSSLYKLPFLSFEWVLVGCSVVEYEEVKVLFCEANHQWCNATHCSHG